MYTKQQGCPGCKSKKVSIIKEQTIKDPRHGLITIQLRQCGDCFKRYKVAMNAIQEWYY